MFGFDFCSQGHMWLGSHGHCPFFSISFFPSFILSLSPSQPHFIHRPDLFLVDCPSEERERTYATRWQEADLRYACLHESNHSRRRWQQSLHVALARRVTIFGSINA
jgi:hypothetical protein